MFLVLFCSRLTAYIVRDNVKKIYINRFILHGLNVISKNILRVRGSLRKISSISCEFSGLNIVATL